MDPGTPDEYLDSDYPLGPPPEGVMQNLVDPDSDAYKMYITAGICMTIMTVFPLMRFLSKIQLGTKTVKIDESEYYSGPPLH